MNRFVAIAMISGLLATSCTLINDTLALEHRIFIRIPAKNPIEGDSYDPNTGWHFRHVLQGPSLGKRVVPSQWYLAWCKDGGDRLTNSGKLPPWKNAQALAPKVAEATFNVFKCYPQLIEPGAIFKQGLAEKKAFQEPHTRPSGEIPTLQVGNLPLKIWPEGVRNPQGQLIPGWHLDDQHSQLAAARNAVRSIPGNPGKNIRIGILDTGFDGRHLGIPAHLEDDPRGDAMLALRPEFDNYNTSCELGPFGPTRPGLTLASGHGTGAIGILAGKKICIAPNTKGVQPGVFEPGAAPDATIVPVRIAPGPASLSTANLAYGIDYASRIKRCDVLSLSHGGSPSMMWTDAVNAAYDRGTAIFAATGDYFPLPPFIAPVSRLNRTGIIVPSSTVYPAAYRRAMGVAGVTETGKPYARPDYPRYWFNFFKPSQLFNTDSFMRGSYGADGVRRSYTDARKSREHKNTDFVQLTRNNELRANPICAYSPGIPWLHAAETETDTPSTVIDLDGAGTSAATPQAAAAAAHWLAFHEKEIRAAGGWNDWRKAEATYLAMSYSARRTDQGTSVKENQKPDVYLGCGTLKAKDMLAVSYRKALQLDGKTLSRPIDINKNNGIKTERPNGSPRDIYDGDRSLVAAVFRGDRDSAQRDSEIAKRADFRQEPSQDDYLNSQLKDAKEKAMLNLYFNMLLVQQFQLGNNPVNLGTQTCPHRGFKKLISVPNEAQLQEDAFYLATGRKFVHSPCK